MHLIHIITFEEARKILESGRNVFIVMNPDYGFSFYYMKVCGLDEFDALEKSQSLSQWVSEETTNLHFASEFEQLTCKEPLDYEEGKYMFTNNEPSKVKDWMAMIEKYC